MKRYKIRETRFFNDRENEYVATEVFEASKLRDAVNVLASYVFSKPASNTLYDLVYLRNTRDGQPLVVEEEFIAASISRYVEAID